MPPRKSAGRSAAKGAAKGATKRAAKKGATKGATKATAGAAGADADDEAAGGDDAATATLHRTCGAMAAHMLLMEQHPAFHARQFKLEQETERRRQQPFALAQQAIARIRVVVNVVYQTAAQNVSQAQIDSQLAVLNADFRAANADRSKVPAVWKGLVTDARIEFVLEKVTRTQTTRTSFDINDGVKAANTGGIRPHEPKKFLNIWVCALRGGLLGYAQFPGGPLVTDGVVINYRAFGTRGTAQAPFDLGRTTTHEVGHYLNLRHIWGDTDDCSQSDLAADTPNCAGPNFGTPTFPKVSCNNGPSGDMFVNYMDYVDDRAMFMFTTQQVLRMRTALQNARSGLLT